MKRIELSEFELGALYAVLPYSSLAKLPDGLSKKLKGYFRDAEREITIPVTIGETYPPLEPMYPRTLATEDEADNG